MRIKELSFEEYEYLTGQDIPFPRSVTPYQSVGYIKSYLQSGQISESDIVIMELCDEEVTTISVFWLYKQIIGGLNVLRFVGNTNNNINMPWLLDYSINCDFNVIRNAIEEHMKMNKYDVLLLEHMPESWNGVANPIFHKTVAQPVESLYLYDRKHEKERQRPKILGKRQIVDKVRQLEIKFDSRYIIPRGDEEVANAIGVFLRQSKARLEKSGVGHYYKFIERIRQLECASKKSNEVDAPIEWKLLKIGDKIGATYATMSDDVCQSAILNSIDTGDYQRQGPGNVLLYYIVEEFMRGSRQIFDMGIGYARYKKLVCNRKIKMYNVVISIGCKGKSAMVALRAYYCLKYFIKSSKTAMKIIKFLRSAVARAAKTFSHK